jgi:hypothetical protein
MGIPVEDPDVFSGRFSQTLLHPDFGTSLPQKSLNLNLKDFICFSINALPNSI